MADASTSFHEPVERLSEETLETRRGIASFMEELEAVDWYSQRIDAAQDPQLRAILAHNRDEEKEHAMMTLEWLRRRDPALDAQMRTYLFTEGDILAAEEEGAIDEAPAGEPATDGSLGIGSLRGEG
ncbi:ferritin-like domain-containing protein [Salinisphaera sp.]|uniref:ferritin-like domain-containing protein n=1 Tax=Salinisphaera sp. TaxID=1914330 RepID=UPI002D795694|nr:ferritin-like domain-containing protein [Salinisphaera sp.]HET7315134.1 ferritin-like domain-containing protein [Salinisphaera sp.]